MPASHASSPPSSHRLLVHWRWAENTPQSELLEQLADQGWYEPVWFSSAQQQSARQLLGQEHRLVVLDQRQAISADDWCICLGLVREGGVMLWLTPSNPAKFIHSQFYDYLQQHLITLDGVYCETLPHAGERPTPPDNPTRYQQQQALYWHFADSLPKAPWIVRAARGRGKSALLGQWARHWQRQHQARIVVCSYARSATTVLYQFCGSDMDPPAYFAADRLIAERPSADVLIIDEAASLPLKLLLRLLQHYPACVMATTTEGYEGSGQGFGQRLLQRLQSQYPNMQLMQLNTPLRWRENDPLEQFQNTYLLPSLSRQRISVISDSVNQGAEVEYAWLEFDQRQQQSKRLRQAFALLRDAHYRNRPNDLQQCLENPDLLLLGRWRGEQLEGILQLHLEGGIDTALSKAIWLGQRRLKGHLLAQAITAQVGLPGFAELKGARISRIVVAAELRRQGLATELVQAAWSLAQQQHLDWLGVSFGYEVELLQFWLKQKLQPVHIGYRQGPSSAEPALMLIRSCTSASTWFEALQQRWNQQLPYWLRGHLHDLEAEQQRQLYLTRKPEDLSALELAELRAFAHGHKGLELSSAAIQRALWPLLERAELRHSELLLDLFLHQNELHQVVQKFGFSGKQEITQKIRQWVAEILL